ncbi:hypothetical protein ACOMHN_032933 [Nucella lapillus]
MNQNYPQTFLTQGDGTLRRSKNRLPSNPRRPQGRCDELVTPRVLSIGWGGEASCDTIEAVTSSHTQFFLLSPGIRSEVFQK